MNDSVIVFDRIDNAILTSSAGSDANYPLTNLQDGRYNTQWKSGGKAAGQTLKIEQPDEIIVSSILIVNHNLDTLGLTSLVIEGSDDDFATDVTVLHTFNAFGSDPLYAENFSFDKVAHRLKFNRAIDLAFEPTIGMIFLGHPAKLPLYLNNPKRGLKADLIRDESLSGLRYASASSGPRQTWKFDWSLKKSPNADFWRWLKSVGVGLHPFWIKDMDDHWHFVRNDFDNVESGSKGNVSFDWRNIQMSEERVGIPIELPGEYTV